MTERYQLYQGDCLDILPTLEAQSIDAVIGNIPFSWYNSPMKTPKISDQKMMEMYLNGDNLRQISRVADIDHHRVKRILLSHDVELRGTYTLPPFTDEHKRKIGEASTGRIPKNKGIPATNKEILRYISARIEGDIDISKFKDAERLKILTRITSKRKQLKESDEIRQQFLDTFYFDIAFNAIYDLWIRSGKCKWHRPTLDHKMPLSKGGGWEIENLQFLTWFENRAKADMPANKWESFKRDTGTQSALFIENIINE
jgi:hypothetical protein